MKKKILLALACVISVIMLCAISPPCFAEEVSDTSESVSDATEHTVFTRVWEYVVNNKTETLTLIGDFVILIVAIYTKLRNDKRTKTIESDLKIVRGDTSGTVSGQTSVVDAVNNMIDGYNGMRESYEKYENTETDRNRLVGAVMVQNTALLEILTTVYVNSKNLPQGVKDLVNLKYARCQKALGNDELLCAIVESVREKIGTNMEPKEESDTSEV